MSEYIKFSGIVWSLENNPFVNDDIEYLEESFSKATEKFPVDFEFNAELVDEIYPDKLELPWPSGKTRNDLDKEFTETGILSSEEFGLLWLHVNIVVRDSAMRAGVETSDRRMRWLCYKIARGVCLWLKAQEVAEEATIETES